MSKVADIMTKQLLTVTKDQTIDKANQIMAENKINHILIVGPENTLIGILSDRDTKKFLSPFIGSGRETEQDKATMHIKVEKIMKTELMTVSPEDPIKLVIEKMLQKSVHAVPVVEAGTMKLKGIVTTTNILRWISSTL